MVLRYLIEKEFKQMMRNIVLPLVFVLLPLTMMNMVPRAATQEVKNLTITIADHDHSALSARLVQKLGASAYFTIVGTADTYRRALEDVDRGTADFIVEIEPGFERRLVREGTADVLVAANAVNGVKAGLGSSYLSQIIADYAAELRPTAPGAAMQMKPRYLYNTELDYKVFMIPGLMAMLLILVVGFLPALNVVGEKEKGTIEQINVTPIRRFDFILSKLIPYWTVGLFILAYSFFLAWAIYGFVPVGSALLILLFATVFVLLISSLGLIVSNYSGTMQQAALVMFFFLVIFILMSGLITPVASMPEWAQAITRVNPLRYFIEALRMICLKGSSLGELSTHLFALAAYTVLTWTWAVISYRKNG